MERRATTEAYAIWALPDGQASASGLCLCPLVAEGAYHFIMFWLVPDFCTNFLFYGLKMVFPYFLTVFKDYNHFYGRTHQSVLERGVDSFFSSGFTSFKSGYLRGYKFGGILRMIFYTLDVELLWFLKETNDAQYVIRNL